MPLLLDTQVLIWVEKKDTPLSPKTLKTILSEPVLLVSKVSVWELAIKVKTGKLDLGKPIDEFVESFLSSYKAKILDISLAHIYQTEQLPLYHRDPFDRLLIAQAASERIPIVSSDEWFDQYEIKRIW